MRLAELSAELGKMWNSVSKGDQTPQMHLFGIRYADHLQGWSVKELSELAQEAELSAHYGIELHKMVRLAQFVQEK